MISAISSILGSAIVQRAQGVSTSVASPRDQEDRQKKISIPSVEVTAAQSQGLSARVGDFLVNKASQSSDSGSATSGVSGPTAADGTPPSGPPPSGPPPGPPPDEARNGGQNNERGSSSAQSVLSLLADDDTDETSATSSTTATSSASSILSLLSGTEGATETENDGDADDTRAGASSTAPKSRQGANTQYALQQNTNGVFGVQFDEIGAYQFAASSH